MKTQFLVPLSLLAAAGCSWLPSVGPDYTEPEVEIPACGLPDAGLPTTNRTEVGEYVPAVSNADYRTVVTTNEIAAWWTRFDDAELTNLVASAVAENLSYLMAQERLVASRWELLGSYAAYLPQVRGDASFTRLQQQKHASSRWGSGSDLNRDVFAGGFDATWEIDIFGGSRRATESAKAAAEAAEWSLADAWVSLTAEVGSRYLALRTTQQRIETARTNLVLQT